jgi:hypothetical protein
MRGYVLESAARSIFFPLFGPGFFYALADWKLGLRATWKTGSLLEEASAFRVAQGGQSQSPLEENLLELSEIDLPKGVQEYYSKFIKGTPGYERINPSQVVTLLAAFNELAAKNGNCFLPCHSDGSLIKCTRRHLLRWMLPESSAAPDVEVRDGQEWVKVDLELSSSEFEPFFLPN